MKNNIEFYQHYANADQHSKFKMLRVQYGWSGEGKFWALNNRIAQAENCCLNVSKKYNKAAIASDLNFKLKEFDEFINFLMIDCELIKECEDGVITTDIIQETFLRVSKDREAARARAARRFPKQTSSSPEKNKSSPEKVCIVKESKVKESNKKEIYTPVFLKFWEAYPRKIGKGAAFKAYTNIKEPRPNLKEILFSIDGHKKTEQWGNKQFIPNPSTWLNQRRWEDEIDNSITSTLRRVKTKEEREQEEREAFANR